MPTIDDYAPLAPFQLEELVSAVNSVLRDRPTLQIQSRTVRYYISSGLLPPPSGGPKFARYGIEHLKRIVAIRQWLDQGMSLEQAAERIQRGEHGGETETVQRRSVSRVQSPPREFAQKRNNVGHQTVRRIPLTPFTVLEVDADADLRVELERARDALREIFQGFLDTD